MPQRRRGVASALRLVLGRQRQGQVHLRDTAPPQPIAGGRHPGTEGGAGGWSQAGKCWKPVKLKPLSTYYPKVLNQIFAQILPYFHSDSIFPLTCFLTSLWALTQLKMRFFVQRMQETDVSKCRRKKTSPQFQKPDGVAVMSGI